MDWNRICYRFEQFARLIDSYVTHGMKKGDETPYCEYVTTRTDVSIDTLP